MVSEKPRSAYTSEKAIWNLKRLCMFVGRKLVQIVGARRGGVGVVVPMHGASPS